MDMHKEVLGQIDGPPQGQAAAWATCTGNDQITVDSWGAQWSYQLKANARIYNFSDNSAMKEHGKCGKKPCILAGSGPSLRKSLPVLLDKDPGKGRGDIPIVSALHNFPYFEDNGIMTANDYYVNLDAGDITARELSEGGKEDSDFYWERSKDRVLISVVNAHPDLLRRWKGKILWFGVPSATEEQFAETRKYVDFGTIPAFNVGGNVMGAALYFARAVLGCSIPIFIGMDLSFSYDKKFHAWDSQYDKKFSGVMPCYDIFGNRVWTWPSYWGFKNWFDYMACGGQGGNGQVWINATEGGIMGAYVQGNIKQILQLDLKTALAMFRTYEILPSLVEKSASDNLHLLF